MKNFNISVRLDKKTNTVLRDKAALSNISLSDYVRSLILDNTSSTIDEYTDKHSKVGDKELASIICRMYILLTEKNLDSEPLTNEVHKICQLLK